MLGNLSVANNLGGRRCTLEMYLCIEKVWWLVISEKKSEEDLKNKAFREKEIIVKSEKDLKRKI